MPNTYGTVITSAGAAIISECILSGKKLVIQQAAAGDGGGAYYRPTADQTALKNETWRGEVAAAQISPVTPNMIDVKVVIGDDVGGFTIREMGLFDESGALIAVCNTPDTEKVATSGGVSGKLTMLMHIVVADASVVEFQITSSLDVVSGEDLEQAVTKHNEDEKAHAEFFKKEKGNPDGLASLDGFGKIPVGQIPDLNYIPNAEKGAPEGVATLDKTGKVPESQLPGMNYDPAGSAAQVQTNLNTHISEKAAHITDAERTNWNDKAAGGHSHVATDITYGTLGVARGGTGAATLVSGAALIGNGANAVTTRAITNNTNTTTTIPMSTNLITSNTLRYGMNRTTSVAAADTNYTIYMARGIALVSSTPSSMLNGTVALVY